MGKFYRRKRMAEEEEMRTLEDMTEHQKHELRFQGKSIKEQQKAIKAQQEAVEKWISEQF